MDTQDKEVSLAQETADEMVVVGTNNNSDDGVANDDESMPKDGGHISTVTFASRLGGDSNTPNSSLDQPKLTSDSDGDTQSKVFAKPIKKTVKTDNSTEEKHTLDQSLSNKREMKMKRLSSSVEHVDLEYSLGSLDSPPTSSHKRQIEPPSSTGSVKKKRLSPVPPPSKSLSEALANPKFWQESASVSENNIASASFDVADEEGGSSPLSGAEEDIEDGPLVGDNTDVCNRNLAQRRLSDEEKRSIGEAEDIMRAAALAAQAETPDNIGGDSNSKGKTAEKGTSEEDMNDFDRHVKSDTKDTGDDDLDSNVSSASSLVESYLAEEEYSRPLPPAPPSTPAASKDSLTPLPYQSSLARGKLSTSKLMCSDDSLVNDKSETSSPLKDIPPPPAYSSADEDDKTPPAGGKGNRSRLKQRYHTKNESNISPSGAATEPRRGGGGDHAGKPKPTTKSDFDKWDVGDRYQLKRMLGRGSYGEVAQAVDLRHQKEETQSPSKKTDTSTYVAVKKISKAFDSEVDAIRLYREMHILRKLKGHACVIQLLNIVQPRSSDLSQFNDLYLVFEYVDTDLYKLIMSPQYLTTEHIQTFLFQMLVGLKYIHSSSGKFDIMI